MLLSTRCADPVDPSLHVEPGSDLDEDEEDMVFMMGEPAVSVGGYASILDKESFLHAFKASEDQSSFDDVV